MLIQIDSREQKFQHIIDYFDANNINYINESAQCFVGDYWNWDNPRVFIDRKQNLSEVYNNICHEHDRFRNELLKAQKNALKLIILVEHGRGIETLEDVMNWKNPQLKKSQFAWNGEALYKRMRTMEFKYGIDWVFCDKSETGKKIVELLGGE